MTRLAALLTVHNRKEKTLAALEKLFAQEKLPAGLELTVYLVDDGSSDGTSAAVAQNFPQVHLMQGTGHLFWCGGMHLAFREALREDFDHYLWLNDDTLLFQNALSRLLDVSEKLNNRAIVVASVQDPQTGVLTYGGVKRLHRQKPLNFTQIMPAAEPIPVETMNGNCVLMPRVVVQKVGNLDSAFTHGIGDFDYGLRARQLGIEVFIAPGYYGHCKRNPIPEKLSLCAHWKRMLSPRGLPFMEWRIFAKRHAGKLWPLYWLSPYIREVFSFFTTKRNDI